MPSTNTINLSSKSRSKYITFIDDVTIKCQVIRNGGTCITIPMSWRGRDVFIMYPDGFTEIKAVDETYTKTYIKMPAVYNGRTVIVKLL